MKFKEIRGTCFVSFKDGETDPLHKHSYALVLCAIVVLAVNSRELGNYIFIFIIIGFFFSWFFLEHFRLHTSNWYVRRTLNNKNFTVGIRLESKFEASWQINLRLLKP